MQVSIVKSIAIAWRAILNKVLAITIAILRQKSIAIPIAILQKSIGHTSDSDIVLQY